jgi:hypothetical protein
MKVKFYLTARSNPIIEHCCELSFGPYIDTESMPALSYGEWKTDSEQAGLQLTKNFFD